jgi:hypothetical protein
MLKRDAHFLPVLALGTAGCLWGTGFYFGKIALGEMPVATMVLFRFVFACAGLLPVIFFDRPHVAGTEWGWVLAASLLGVPVQYLVQFKGLSLTTISHASLMRGQCSKTFSGKKLLNAPHRFLGKRGCPSRPERYPDNNRIEYPRRTSRLSDS